MRSAPRLPFPPALGLAVGLISVSLGAIFFRLADAPPLVESAYRTGLATLMLLPFALANHRAELRGLTRGQLGLALLGGAMLAIHFAAWTASLDFTTVASSTVLVSTHPIFVALLTPFISTDRIGRLTVFGILLSVVGSMVIGWGDMQIGGQALIGDALAVVGALGAALYFLIGRRLRATLSLLPYIVLCYGMAALFLLGTVLALGLPLTGYTQGTYVALFFVALVPQVLGHSSFNWALGYFSATLVAVVLLGEPILSTIWAFLFLNETPPAALFQGAALILLGVYLAARGEAAPQPEPEEIAA